jgi:virulence-associated protein VagC
MAQFAELFRNGSSQAVRLPHPEEWLAMLKNIPADPDFMAQRNQPRTPRRKIFE